MQFFRLGLFLSGGLSTEYGAGLATPTAATAASVTNLDDISYHSCQQAPSKAILHSQQHSVTTQCGKPLHQNSTTTAIGLDLLTAATSQPPVGRSTH
jgi:hypothetical protein